MRIARPITPNAIRTARASSFQELGAAYRELAHEAYRAQNRADVAMAANLRRSRSLARREA